ncbi:hypothetical protein FACS1894145_6510 [Bacteroidia bacterium]|nr:hypothetical protein FACS1894145_6510 [Bacteroidia bacterium]
MREKMKKMLFLMLFLLILGAANVTSQVRIGGNGTPNGAAVLDLNATDAINNGTKTLALPRVSLTSTTDQLGYTTLLNGMLVYNTTATPGASVYYWDTNKWVKVSGGEFVEGDGVIGNEITDTIANGGLTRSGAGTVASPYKVGIKAGGVTGNMIANYTIDPRKLDTTGVIDRGVLVKFADGVRFSSGFYLQHVKVTRAAAWPAPFDTLIPWSSIGCNKSIATTLHHTNDNYYRVSEYNEGIRVRKLLDGAYECYFDAVCFDALIGLPRKDL